MRPRDENKVPLALNERCQMLLGRLREGSATTLDLQKALPLVHVARQIWELRHWYGFVIETDRLPSGVAVYTLVDGGVPVVDPLRPGATRAPVEWRCPVCMRPGEKIVRSALDPNFVTGTCPVDGHQRLVRAT